MQPGLVLFPAIKTQSSVQRLLVSEYIQYMLNNRPEKSSHKSGRLLLDVWLIK